MINEKFDEYIKPGTVIARSPGRINFIGEHTDYNNGFVLPAAIDKSTFVAVTPRNDKEINLVSLDLNDNYFTTIDNIHKSHCHWANYILGVVDQFRHKGIEVIGFDLAFYGEIPMGGGLSSSAALECATALALNKMLKADFDKLQLTHMAQMAEHTYAGVQCGIMDQFASLFGKSGMAIKLDCKSLDFEYIPIHLDQYSIVLFDSNVKHSLASSEYNVRRQECEYGVKLVAKNVNGVSSLRDITLKMLDEYVLPVDENIYNKCRYVIEENQRLIEGCLDLQNGDIKSFGKKMFETHNGLSTLYNVSCSELDFLVDFAHQEKGVIGARMMGGGFGGCTINIVKNEDLQNIIKNTSRAYSESMKRELGIHQVKIEDGGSLI